MKEYNHHTQNFEEPDLFLRYALFGFVSTLLVLIVIFNPLSNKDLDITQTKINTGIENTTTEISQSVDNALKQIEFYEVTMDESHLVMLQSELTKIETLLEQNDEKVSYLNIDIGDNHLLDKVSEMRVYLENTLIGEERFNQGKVFDFEETMLIVSEKTKEEAGNKYGSFVCTANKVIEYSCKD